MKKYNKIFAVILAISTVFSCTFSPDDSGEKGYITISIPPLIPDYEPDDPGHEKVRPPYLLNTLSTQSRARAYGFVTRFELFLRNSGGTIVESWEFEWDGYPGKTIQVNTGTGYTLEVKLYNDIASTSPTATGISEPFDVTAGNWSSVYVTCLPTQAMTASPNTIYSCGSIPTYYDYTTYKIVHYGGECWYSITALYSVTAFEITPERGNHALLYLFDSSGESVGFIPHYAFLYRPEGSSCTLLTKTTIGETYYIVVCPITPDGDLYSTVDFRFYQGPDDDIYEENDENADATPILPDEELTGLLLDMDYFQFTVNSAIGLTVIVDINITNAAVYYIYLCVEDSEKHIVTWTTFDNCIYYKSTQPFTITLPDEGTYYFILEPIVQGAAYTVAWYYE